MFGKLKNEKSVEYIASSANSPICLLLTFHSVDIIKNVLYHMVVILMMPQESFKFHD